MRFTVYVLFSNVTTCCFVMFDRSNDSGLLSHKEHLPVGALAIGDISRSGSEAAYRVGPMQCYGDSKCRTDLILPALITL